MLYVFLVDTGTMIQLDMNHALEKVGYLKGVIARSASIPPDKQVLLISGGESLNSDEMVCKYATGTDTNPIFLFSTLNIENPLPPDIGGVDEGAAEEQRLSDKVDSSLGLKDAQSTVAVRATLAQEFVRASTEQTRLCETLIHDQHLQHQGWLAVVANLEEIALDLQRRAEKTQVDFENYLQSRDEYQLIIDKFDDDLAILNQIPVFSSLLRSSSMIGSTIPGQTNLLDWINSRGSNQSLEQLADSCYRTIGQMDEELLKDLTSKTSAAVEGAANDAMKEIRGLGDRLSGLEQLLIEAKRLVQEQHDLAQAFVNNQQRASGLKDASILPDLCASHKQQLAVMRHNHQRVISIRQRCSEAKQELSSNLHQRMKWIVFIQNQMAEVNQLLLLHSEELRRLKRKLEVVEQIHLAPTMYMATVLEVVRRKAFSKHFLDKADALADTFGNIHEEEVSLRTNFQSKLKKHFLAKMFTGMDDLPPPFAKSSPDRFDDNLPDITLEDVEKLRKQFPDLAKSLSVPESNALSNLLARSFNQKLTAEEGETLFSLQNMPGKIHIRSTDIGSVSVMNKLIKDFVPRRKNSRRAGTDPTNTDSETDTDAETNTFARKKYSRSLTRSLPLEASTLTLETTNAEKATGNSSSSAVPSSSSGMNTANNSSVAPSSSSDGSCVKPGLVDSIKGEEMGSKLGGVEMMLKLVKSELDGMKSDHLEDKEKFLKELEFLGKDLDVQLANYDRNKEEAVKDVEVKLEVERNKLEDCHREIDIYRHQLESATSDVDNLKADIEEQKENFLKAKKDILAKNKGEWEEHEKRLLLEHELEMENLRNDLENNGKVAKLESTVDKLKSLLENKELDIEGLRKKTILLERNQAEKYQSEKDKIVQILEAGFSQREKLSLQEHERQLEEKFDVERQKLLEGRELEFQLTLNKLKEDIQQEKDAEIKELKLRFEREFEELQNRQQEISIAAVEIERGKFNEEMKHNLATQAKQLRAKYKSEVEGLRQRFKMMQTAGAIERSPSCSESEFFESPRQDLVENIRSSLLLEFDNNLKLEKAKWERQFIQLKDDHDQALADLKAEMELKDCASQQVKFNEALAKAIEEKEKEFEMSKLCPQDQEELDLLRKKLKNYESLKEKNAQLESELKELKVQRRVPTIGGMTDSTMTASVFAVPPENGGISMSQSMVKNMAKGNVSVSSVERGQTVMVVWSQEYGKYTIYTEGGLLLHFLHSDSYHSLGLNDSAVNKKLYVTAEVVDKEYCQARKAENRFRVPQGTKFYRVKCKPVVF